MNHKQVNKTHSPLCEETFRLSRYSCGSGEAPLYAQSNYTAFELIRENNWTSDEDLNGDGAKDIVYSAFDPAFGRELHIHYQEEDGGFNANPSRIEIKTEIIAVVWTYGKNPARSWCCSQTAVFSVFLPPSGYAGNLKLLSAWDLIATFPISSESISATSPLTSTETDLWIF